MKTSRLLLLSLLGIVLLSRGFVHSYDDFDGDDDNGNNGNNGDDNDDDDDDDDESTTQDNSWPISDNSADEPTTQDPNSWSGPIGQNANPADEPTTEDPNDSNQSGSVQVDTTVDPLGGGSGAGTGIFGVPGSGALLDTTTEDSSDLGGAAAIQTDTTVDTNIINSVDTTTEDSNGPGPLPAIPTQDTTVDTNIINSVDTTTEDSNGPGPVPAIPTQDTTVDTNNINSVDTTTEDSNGPGPVPAIPTQDTTVDTNSINSVDTTTEDSNGPEPLPAIQNQDTTVDTNIINSVDTTTFGFPHVPVDPSIDTTLDPYGGNSGSGSRVSGGPGSGTLLDTTVAPAAPQATVDPSTVNKGAASWNKLGNVDWTVDQPIDPVILSSLLTDNKDGRKPGFTKNGTRTDQLADGEVVHDDPSNGEFPQREVNLKDGQYVLTAVQTKGDSAIYDPFTIGQVLGYLYEYSEFQGVRPVDGWTLELFNKQVPISFGRKKRGGSMKTRRASLIFKKKAEVIAKEEEEYWKQFMSSL